MLTRSTFVGALAGALAAGVACGACPPGEQLQYSADLPATLSGTFAQDHEYFIDTGTALARARIDASPERADLDALQIDANGDVLFSLDVGVVLGGAYYDRADLIRKSDAGFSLAFDASTAGIPPGVNLDAAARRGANLLLSFDRSFARGAVVVRPADVVEFNGTTYVGKVLDATALGLGPALNLDAVHAVSNGELLVSFDTGGRIAGANIVFADEDILDLVLAGAAWSKPCALRTRSERWGALNLDALSATPGGDGLFKDGFE